MCRSQNKFSDHNGNKKMIVIINKTPYHKYIGKSFYYKHHKIIKHFILINLLSYLLTRKQWPWYGHTQQEEQVRVAFVGVHTLARVLGVAVIYIVQLIVQQNYSVYHFYQ